MLGNIGLSPRVHRKTGNKLFKEKIVITAFLLMQQPKLIQLPKFLDARGNLSFAEQYKQVPFKIERAYWIYDVPGGEARGGHAYRENEEFIIALSGSFDVVLDNGVCKQCFSLNRSYYGLYVPRGMWREMNNFSTNSFALILASAPYAPEDYIRDYDQFKTFAHATE
jgi:dTDP-4-dehydrorhamnose 3,5-epimerase-like enzyme